MMLILGKKENPFLLRTYTMMHSELDFATLLIIGVMNYYLIKNAGQGS